ncbi:SNF2 family N-terminal domain-containing protein [Trichoderma camerunense]
MNRQALEEELTVQEVILDSLQDEAGEDAEVQRDEARREIVRLKRMLRTLSMTKTAAGGEAGQDTIIGGPRAAHAQSQTSHAPASSPQRNSDHSRTVTPAPVGASRSHRSSAVMDTPRHAVPVAENGESPSLVMLNRKRNYDAAHLSVGRESSKSRRTTPSPFGGFSRAYDPPSSDGEVEIIDLTGADVDADSTRIAEQYRQAERHRQEKEDREMALRLSSQDSQSSARSASGPSGPSRSSGSHQPSAFSRLMATQRSNAPEAPIEIASDDELEVIIPGGGPHDGAVAWGSLLAAPTANPSFGHNQFSGLLEPQQLQGHSNPPTPVGNGFELPSFRAVSQSFPGTPFAGNNQMPFGHMPMPGAYPGPPLRPNLPMGPVLASQSRTPLSDIINRTSMFDYANGLDNNGDPLSGQLMDYLNDTFHDPRVTEQELDDLLQNIRPDMEIPEGKRDGTPEGLKHALYPHQTLALTWMKKMETGTNKGGILADDMGLGKTISTLALMLSRPAQSRPKTNLIIGPLALIRQWEEEIYKKTKPSHRLSVFVYHNKKATADDLLKYDVVLTTYGTIAQELKRLDKFMEDNAGRNIDFTDRTNSAKFPLLNPRKSKFHRVILDEAQCIKNHNTKTAKACHKLNATHRWCLTGTPMMNGVLELYSLLCFLRIKPYCIWEQFRRSFGVLFGRNGDPKNVAMNRLRALLKAIMLRRKKDSKLDGKPILRLPKKMEEVVYAELSGDERDFYNQLEKKSQVQFSKYLREGSVGKNYSSILVLLLRLRQACCHPHLNLDVDDVAPISSEEMLELVKKLDASIVARIREADAFECPICYDAVQSPTFYIPCGHDSCKQCLSQLVDSAATMNLQQGNDTNTVTAKCPVCRGRFDPRQCFTYEAFQQVHMPESIKPSTSEGGESDSSTEDEDDFDEDETDDEVDRYGDLKDFIVRDEIESGSEAGEKDQIKKEKKQKKKKKDKKTEIRPSMLKTLRKEASKNKAAFKKYMSYLRKTWLPAAKVSECMNLLKEIHATGEKTIVFSQWTLLLDLLEVAAWHDDYPGKLRRYDGSMSAEQRFVAARDFRDKSDVKVMLVSLRAGNAGLNLTAASRVVIMDPFWNPYIEMQAVDRAYRIGQMREVKVYRILTKETVEDRIVELQERKKEMVEAALDEAESSKIGRLGVNELKFLFSGR